MGGVRKQRRSLERRLRRAERLEREAFRVAIEAALRPLDANELPAPSNPVPSLPLSTGGANAEARAEQPTERPGRPCAGTHEAPRPSSKMLAMALLAVAASASELE